MNQTSPNGANGMKRSPCTPAGHHTGPPGTCWAPASQSVRTPGLRGGRFYTGPLFQGLERELFVEFL